MINIGEVVNKAEEDRPVRVGVTAAAAESLDQIKKNFDENPTNQFTVATDQNNSTGRGRSYSVRSRVRNMQRDPPASVHDLSQGTIEALEAVAATAIIKRTSPDEGRISIDFTSSQLGELNTSEGAIQRSASVQGEFPRPSAAAITPSKLPTRRRLGRGMAALSVAGSTSTTRRWSSSSRSASGKSNSRDERSSKGNHSHHVSPRSIFRMASSDALSRARTSFGSSPRPSEPTTNKAGSASVESSSSGTASPNAIEVPDSFTPIADTLPKKGRVRAAAEALGAAQTAAAAARNDARSPPVFRSITGSKKSSPASGAGSGSASNNSDGSSTRRQKARGWWTNKASNDKAQQDEGGRTSNSTSPRPAVIGVRAENVELRLKNAQLMVELDDAAEAKRTADAARAENVLLRSENYQLRAEGRLLEEAVRAAQGKATALESMSSEVSKEAASKVRKADALRVKAEEAAQEAESKCYSLSATVEVLKSTTDFASGERKGSEAEVTAAYQRILQDMDMERAALQEKLTSALRENDMLRTQVLKTNPSLQSQSGTESNGNIVEPLFDLDNDSNPVSPRLKQRSFLRPRARPFSSSSSRPSADESAGESRGAVEMTRSFSSEGRGAGIGERQDGFFKSARGRGGGILFAALGRRVRLVQLEGLNILAGGGDTSEAQLAELEKHWQWTPTSSELSIDAPSPSQRHCPEFPWTSEWARWYSHVSLVVAPGAPRGTMPDVAEPPVHSVLLTDTALYVIQARPGRTGCDMLCRLESHRVEGLSLPLETRPLPNGDEVAVRSDAIVLRLRFLLENDSLGGTPKGYVERSPSRAGQARGRGDPLNGGDAESGRRGFLWFSCATNEARGELVERFCQWHQTNHQLRQQHKQRRRSQEEQGAPRDEADLTSTLVSGINDTTGFGSTGGSVAGASGADEEGVLEVDQILAKELLEDLKDERSLNVTALILADEEMLPPSMF